MNQQIDFVQQPVHAVDFFDAVQVPFQTGANKGFPDGRFVGDAFRFLRMPSADEQEVRLRHSLHDLCRRLGQRSLALTQRDLTDRGDQESVGRDAQFFLEHSRGDIRAKLPAIHAVVDHADPVPIDALFHVGRLHCVRDRHQRIQTPQVLQRRGVQAHDVSNVARGRNAQLFGRGAQQSAHRQAVGVDEIGRQRREGRHQPLGAGGQFFRLFDAMQLERLDAYAHLL